MKIKNEVIACPHCGNSEEFYIHECLKGKIYPRYRFDGGEADNTDLWTHVRSYPQKTAYCGICEKKIGTIEV